MPHTLSLRSQITIGTALVLALFLASITLETAALHDLVRLHQAQADSAAFGQRVAEAERWGWLMGGAAIVLGAVALVLLRRAIAQPLDEAMLIATTVAAGDLSQEFSTERRGEFGRLLSALGTMEDTLTDLVTRIKGSTESIATASRQIDTGNADLAQRFERQAVSVTQAAGSLSLITEAARATTGSAEAASNLADEASRIAARGGSAVGQVVEQMDAITRSSKRVVDIIEVIEGIAFRTNILALNAAVEAARAGDHGRGFAVVANEVQGLAKRSGEAAREIRTLIAESASHVDSGAVLVQQAGGTMQEVVGAVQQVTALLAGVSRSLASQRASIEAVNAAVGEIGGVTQQNASLVQQAAAAAAALASQAEELKQAVDAFKLD